MNNKWMEEIYALCESLDMGDSTSVLLKIRKSDPEFFKKWGISEINSINCPDKISFKTNKNSVIIVESEDEVGKYDIHVKDKTTNKVDSKKGVFPEDITRILETNFPKPINEYERGELKAISDKSRANLSSSSPSSNDSSFDISDDGDEFDSLREKRKSEPKKSVGTNSDTVDSVARTVGTGIKSLRGSPGRMNDFIKHMREEIPDFDKLALKNPRFIRSLRSIDQRAENDLKRVMNSTN